MANAKKVVLNPISLFRCFFGLLLLTVPGLAGVRILPVNPAGMAVSVEAGSVVLPGGKTVEVKAVQLKFDAPEIRDFNVDAKAPRNYASWYEPWDCWPGYSQDKKINYISLYPKTDEEGTLILGSLYRSVLLESIVVTNADGSKKYKMNEDYKYQSDWGHIANLNGGLGKEWEADLKVSCKYAVQRLDLVQAGPDGVVTVKKGKSLIVCPELPEPDKGCAGLAGIYIAGWKAADSPYYDSVGGLKDATTYAITPYEIFPIKPLPPVAPVNKPALEKSVKKLKAGGEFKIAFIGDSITVGAEAPAWWDNLWTEKNLGYPSRVVTGLRKLFPKSNITPLPAFQGGTTTGYGVEMLKKTVLPKKPDLIVISFGGNDAGGSIGGKPNNPPEKFKEDLRAMIKKSKAANAEVLLVVTMHQSAWLKNKVVERWPEYVKAQLDLAKEEDIGTADCDSEWQNQAARGIPPFSQLHNGLNHPGMAGHKLFAEVILRFFE